MSQPWKYKIAVSCRSCGHSEAYDMEIDPPAPQRNPWAELMRGVRVEGDTVVISVKGGNEAARQLCGELVKEIDR